MSVLKEAVYTCNQQDCRNKQTIRFFAEEPLLPVTCCVKCRAGFGISLTDQIAHGKGMFPGKPVFVD